MTGRGWAGRRAHPRPTRRRRLEHGLGQDLRVRRQASSEATRREAAEANGLNGDSSGTASKVWVIRSVIADRNGPGCISTTSTPTNMSSRRSESAYASIACLLIA